MARAERRLEIASGLVESLRKPLKIKQLRELRKPPLGRWLSHRKLRREVLRVPAGTQIMDCIKSLSEQNREHLRGLVNWVEDYERHS